MGKAHYLLTHYLQGDEAQWRRHTRPLESLTLSQIHSAVGLLVSRIEFHGKGHPCLSNASTYDQEHVEILEGGWTCSLNRIQANGGPGPALSAKPLSLASVPMANTWR